MRIYDINPTDGTAINPAGREAPTDPMRGTPRIPAGATDIEPPATGENEAARWTGDTWELVPDHRGHVYYTADGEKHEIKELGIEPPAEALDEAPSPAEPPEPSYFTYKSDIWSRVTDDEAEVLDTQLRNAPVKQRRMWDDAQSVEHNSDYHVMLRDNMIAEFGEERTDEILAPSNQ